MARLYRIIKFLVPLVSLVVTTADSLLLQNVGSAYRGKYLGPLTSRKHGVSGQVYAVDSRTLHLQGFTYDGTGPDAFFWIGFTESPSPQGIIVPNERGTKEVLTGYNGNDLTISLPDGLTLRDIKWFAVWCRAYEVNFGDLYIPPNFDFPQPHVIGSIVGQGVSSGPIVVVDAQTILVPDFTYDGQAPDLHFWVGRGTPGPDGIRVPDETGGDATLARADKKTLVLSLPGDLTIFDIDYFGLWSRLYGIDYGHVRIQPGLNVPPSLRMLGISPQTRLNCEVLHDESALEIRWSVVGSGETIVFQLVGRIDPGNYMSFGLSGESDRSVMLGADAVVGWLDQSTGRGHVTDYYLERKSVCKGNTGSCPDVQWKEGTNNVRMLSAASVNGFTILTFQRKLGAADIYDKAILTNGSQPVIWAVGPIKDGLAHYHFLRNKDDLYIDFGRSPRWECPEPEAEPETSQNSPSPATILLQSTQTAAASSAQNTAGGGGGGGAVTVSSQSLTTTTTSPYPSTSSITTTTTTAPTSTEKESVTTQSTASPVPELSGSSAPSQEYKAPVTAPSPTSWAVPPIPCYEPDDRVYYAQLGPTGGAYGYRTITGRQDKPQEAWYINGLLLPEIFLVRSLNYTFVIQGGDNSDIPSDYNPFYITDDPEGGHESKSLIERQGVKVYAGLQLDSRGRNIPTAVGKLCRWIENGNQPADFFTSYAAYQRSLFLNCDKGHSGILHFTPNQDTPDLLYYQSYTKRHLGWKIHVVDDCQVPSESKVHLVQHQQEQHRETPVDAPQLQTTSKSENLGIAIQQQQQQQLSQMSFPQLQLQLHPQTQQQQGSILHLSEQSGATDQRPGESANHQSVVAPFVPIGDSKTILNNPHAVSSISPIPGLGSGRPIENAYLFAASSPTGVPTLTLPNSVMKSPHHHHQQHQPQQQQQFQQQHQQQQIPSIISLDPNRLLINAKPVENGAVPQYASLQGHTVVSMSGQPDTFQFPHNSPFFQLAAMDGGNGATGNRIQNPAAFAPSTYQMSPLSDGHLMRRAGPPPPPSAPQALTSGPLNQFKFSKVGDRSELMYESRPEYFVGTNRAPLLSHPIRYDGIPMHSIMYASTASPISRVNNPISFITHGEKNPGEFAEFPSGAGVPGQNAIQVRFQDSRLRSQAEIAGMGNSDNMKYLELPSAPHNMHIMHPDGSASRIAPSGGAGAPPQVPAWAQSRNLPKREQRHPFFSEPTVHFNRDRIRTSLKSHGRDVRANDNLYEIGKMDERNNSPLQFSTQVRGNNKGIKTIPSQNQPTLFPALRHQPGNHEIVNPRSRSHSSTSLHALHASQRSGPKTQGALQRLEEDTPSRAEKGSDSSNHAEGLLNTNSQPKQQQHNCNATENLSSSCRHDSNLEPSQQLPSPQQTEKDPRPPSSTTLSQPSGSGAREEVGGVGAVPVSSLPKMSKPSRQRKLAEVGAETGEWENTTTTKSTTNTTNNSHKEDGSSGSGSGGVGQEERDHDDHDDDKDRKELIPSMTMMMMESGGEEGRTNTNNATGATSPSYEKVDLRPVYESFSPVFRPSPLDIDGFNVSLNFGTSQKQGTSSKSSSKSKVKMGTSMEATQLSSSTQLNPSVSSSQGSQGHQFTSGKRKFRHPQLLVNIGGPFASTSQQRESPREKALSSILKPNVGSGSNKNPSPFPSFAFANEKIPAGFPHPQFHEAIKLFNFHSHRQNHHQQQKQHQQQHHHHHQHQQHFPYYLSQQQQRLVPPLHFPIFPVPSPSRFPVALPKAPANVASNGPTNSQQTGGTSINNINTTKRNSVPPATQIGGAQHVGITSRNDLLTSHSSPPVITIISASSTISNQEASDSSSNRNKSTAEQLHLQDSHSHKQIDKSSWAHMTALTGESISEKNEGTPAVPHVAISSEENIIHIDGTSVVNRRGESNDEEEQRERNRDELLEELEDRKDVHVNGDEDEVKGQNEDKEQDEGVPKVGRKDGDGEEEGSAPDPLSLTLLTDIWQTINQDNGSKTPSQKPPAVPPPPPPPAPPSRRQIQRGMVASGGRNRPQLVFPIRRQPPPPISPGLHFGQRAF